MLPPPYQHQTLTSFKYDSSFTPMVQKGEEEEASVKTRSRSYTLICLILSTITQTFEIILITKLTCAVVPQ